MGASEFHLVMGNMVYSETDDRTSQKRTTQCLQCVCVCVEERENTLELLLVYMSPGAYEGKERTSRIIEK